MPIFGLENNGAPGYHGVSFEIILENVSGRAYLDSDPSRRHGRDTYGGWKVASEPFRVVPSPPFDHFGLIISEVGARQDIFPYALNRLCISRSELSPASEEEEVLS